MFGASIILWNDDAAESLGVLPAESVDHGMKALCPKAGDVLIMPEALTHGALHHGRHCHSLFIICHGTAMTLPFQAVVGCHSTDTVMGSRALPFHAVVGYHWLWFRRDLYSSLAAIAAIFCQNDSAAHSYM
jgi:hypothetical protein